MRHSRFFSITVAVLLGIYGAVGFYFLPLANFEGDLTRMSQLPESMFGWTREQPAVNPQDMQSASWEEADVLAIGDSFTGAQIWQTVFVRKGIKVRTESWANVNKICADVAGWLKSKGFKGKHIVIESAEKYFEERISTSVSCQNMLLRSQPVPPPKVPEVLPDREKGRYDGRISVGIATAIKVLEYERLSRSPGFKHWNVTNDVYLERLENGCKLFSHARCSDVLFYSKDREEDLGDTVLNDMSTINARLLGYSVTWMVIPDKATVYLHPGKTFWVKANSRFAAPNLLKELRQAVDAGTMDLYLANNTHVSTEGYLLMGDVMYRNMFRHAPPHN